MNQICSFRLCKLTDEELLKEVDTRTDQIYTTLEIPKLHIPARPDSDYDLLIGELILRYKAKSTDTPDFRALYLELREVTQALVDLKDHKDKNGRDEHYNVSKPFTWNAARLALKKYPQTIKG